MGLIFYWKRQLSGPWIWICIVDDDDSEQSRNFAFSSLDFCHDIYKIKSQQNNYGEGSVTHLLCNEIWTLTVQVPVFSSSSFNALEMYSNALRWWCFCLARAGSPGPAFGCCREAMSAYTNCSVTAVNCCECCWWCVFPASLSCDPHVTVVLVRRAGITYAPARHRSDSSTHNWNARNRIALKNATAGTAATCKFLLWIVSWLFSPGFPLPGAFCLPWVRPDPLRCIRPPFGNHHIMHPHGHCHTIVIS